MSDLLWTISLSIVLATLFSIEKPFRTLESFFELWAFFFCLLGIIFLGIHFVK